MKLERKFRINLKLEKTIKSKTIIDSYSNFGKIYPVRPYFSQANDGFMGDSGPSPLNLKIIY